MKQLIALIATTVALSAFAQAPAAKKEETKIVKEEKSEPAENIIVTIYKRN
jgi:hypothetical protein